MALRQFKHLGQELCVVSFRELVKADTCRCSICSTIYIYLVLGTSERGVHPSVSKITHHPKKLHASLPRGELYDKKVRVKKAVTTLWGERNTQCSLNWPEKFDWCGRALQVVSLRESFAICNSSGFAETNQEWTNQPLEKEIEFAVKLP